MIRVGLVDSGLAPGQGSAVRLTAAGPAPAVPDRTGHGSAMAAIILAAAPGARLLLAQLFDEGPTVDALRLARAIDWLAGEGVALINLSLGLRADDAILRAACARAAARGIDLVASTPPRGGPVYPAAWPEVVAVCGDARCGPGEVSALGGDPADFGAWNGDGRRGASCAAATVSGRIAAWRAEGGSGPAADHLCRIARWRGRERRSPADVSRA